MASSIGLAAVHHPSATAHARQIAICNPHLAPARPAVLSSRRERVQRCRPPRQLRTLAVAAPEAGAPTAKPPRAPQPDDIVVVGAVRTPSCRARKGGLKDAPPDDLVVAVLTDLLRRTGVKPEDVDDVCFGSVFPPSSKRAVELRTATLLAGFPNHVPAYTVNRQCAAGLQSIANVAAAIRAGYYSLGIAGGVEVFSVDPLDWQGSDNPRVEGNQEAKDAGMTLGLTAENVAERFGVPREEQDRWAAASHAKAAAAQAAGKFREEIVPVETVREEKGQKQRVVVDSDDGIRADCTLESLQKLKPYFKPKDGTVTVGNCCQNTDCAAAVMLTTRAEAERRGLPIMATLKSFAAVGVDPAVMGTAPTVAVPKALERAGLGKEEVEVFELNEAFASQFAYCMRTLGIPEEKVNPNGGAIALGHPAGATGVRLAVTLLHELARRHNGGGKGQQPKYGVVAMCTGAGMGAAAVFEAPPPNGTASANGGSAR